MLGAIGFTMCLLLTEVSMPAALQPLPKLVVLVSSALASCMGALKGVDYPLSALPMSRLTLTLTLTLSPTLTLTLARTLALALTLALILTLTRCFDYVAATAVRRRGGGGGGADAGHSQRVS